MMGAFGGDGGASLALGKNGFANLSFQLFDAVSGFENEIER